MLFWRASAFTAVLANKSMNQGHTMQWTARPTVLRSKDQTQSIGTESSERSAKPFSVHFPHVW